jgi:hypothetical protein
MTAVVGMRIGRGNGNTLRKPAPVPLFPPQIPRDVTRARTLAAAVESQRKTALAMVRPALLMLVTYPERPSNEYHALGLFIRAVLMKTHVNFNYVKS